MNRLTSQIVAEARKWIGTREEGRNDGPQIRRWLARVNRQPGAPWCATFAWCMLDDACGALGLLNPIEPVAGVHLLRQLAKEQKAWTVEPGPGYVFFIDHGRNSDGQRIGHCGIVVEIGRNAMVVIEGNASESGSREGDRVALRTRRAEEITLGYLDPSMLLAGQMCSEARPENE